MSRPYEVEGDPSSVGGSGLEYLRHLESIAAEDVRRTLLRDRGYGGSWRAAPYENLRRKWDRIRTALAPVPGARARAEDVLREAERVGLIKEAPAFISDPRELSSLLRDLLRPTGDLFAALADDLRPEPLLRDVRDLRRYLALVEAVAIEEGWATPEPEED
jgi:hypothetical protein